MSLTVQGNTSASIALRALQHAQSAMERSLSKLSSGQRAQSARDDAASLAISSRMSGQIVSLQKFVLNATQGTAMLQVAEGSYQRAQDMLLRMRSLASQAQGSNLSSTERGMLNNEYQQLKTEITRIAKSTTFNGQALFDPGNIQFGAAQVLNMAGTGDMDYETGDFNGDGINDILYMDRGDTTNVFLATGRNDGTFNAATATDIGTTGSLIKGDFNGDGKLDFAATDGVSVLIYQNNGTGSFSLTNTYTPTSGGGVAMAAGDLNGDGKDDLAISQTTGPATRFMSIFYSDGTSQRFSTTNSVTWDKMAIADMNNDGKMDLVMESQGAARLGTIINNGNKSYTVNSTYSVAVGLSQASGAGDRRINLVDWDNDGLQDIVSTNGLDVYLFKNTNGTFSTTTNLSNTGGANFVFDNISVADIDGNGVYDVVGYDLNTDSAVALKNGSWSTLISLSTDRAYYTGFADMNRDGKMDVISWNGSGTLQVNLNTGSVGLESTVRVGDNASTLNNVSFRTASMRLNSLDQNLENSMIHTLGTATRAEASVKSALNMLSVYRTGVAASTNRLQAVEDNLGTMVQNLQNGRSALADVDVALEMSNFVSQQILTQSGISMVAQAHTNQKRLLQIFNEGFLGALPKV